MTTRNTAVQLSHLSATLHSTQRYGQTDRQTDRRLYDANSQSYCVHQYDRLKTYYYVISVLTLFTVLAVSGPVNNKKAELSQR